MKHFYFFFLIFLTGINYAQNTEMPIKIDGLDIVLKPGAGKDIKTDKTEIKSLEIKYILDTDYKLTISCADFTNDFTSDLLAKPIIFPNSIVGKEVTLNLKKNGASEKKWSFTVIKAESGGTRTASSGTGGSGTGGGSKKLTFEQHLEKIKELNGGQFSTEGGKMTQFGFVDKEGRIHIFIDYRGNNLLTTIPQGIADAQYIIHVLSPKSLDPTVPTYTIKQRSGSFNDALNFRNSDAKKMDLHSDTEDGVLDQTFLLSTSTENISFDLVSVKEENSELKKNTIESFTIKMTPTYQGSFDIGFVKTELANPTYSMVNSPDGLTKTVKVTDDGKSEGTATIMATFYYSPIIILESIFGKKTIPFYQLNGRNFLDDHKIYERFYPTVGVGLNDKVFENLFFGINWEVVRGFSVFYGWNYRKVNTFDMPGFEAGVTPVTEDQFNYYTNQRWLTKPAYGLKLDLLVVTGLFGKK